MSGKCSDPFHGIVQPHGMLRKLGIGAQQAENPPTRCQLRIIYKPSTCD
jgi:hypothetical protein